MQCIHSERQAVRCSKAPPALVSWQLYPLIWAYEADSRCEAALCMMLCCRVSLGWVTSLESMRMPHDDPCMSTYSQRLP